MEIGYEKLSHRTGGISRRACWLLIAAALLVVGWWAWKEGPGVWREMRIGYLERKCAAYVAPMDSMALFESKFNTRGPNLSVSAFIGSSPPATSRPAAVFVRQPPEYWNRLKLLTGGVITGSQPILFMHGRRTKSGSEWLVIVSRDVRPLPYDSMSASFPADIVKFWGSRSSGLYCGPGDANSFEEFVPRESLKFWEGHADVLDESHFTIRYEMDGAAGTVDGWLEDVPFSDGNATIRLSVRDGPGTRPSKP